MRYSSNISYCIAYISTSSLQLEKNKNSLVMKKFLLFVFLLINMLLVKANNIRVSNVALINQDKTNNTWQVKFDIAWDNSWRTSTNESNWDAAWVFIKYRTGYSTEWKHATLSLSGFTEPSGSTISLRNIPLVTGDSKCTGALIYRSSDGIGNVSFTNAALTWNYGIEIGDGDKVEVFLSAIEMVLVNEGGFALGDGSSSASTFKNAGTGLPFAITSEASFTLGGTSAANLIGDVNGQDFSTSITRPLPAKFPKGYNAFYCMKYECSIGQYTDFLNKITPVQSAYHYEPATSILFAGTIYSTTTPNGAVNNVGFRSALAYADWSGLRLMTELEYEKACRGSLPPVLGESAGGSPFSALHTVALVEVINSGTPTEAVSSPFPANHLPLLSSMALRCGSMAIPGSTRLYCDGSYFGIQDLTGNLAEYTIGLTNLERTTYDNIHGNGSILTDGRPTWYGSLQSTMVRSNVVSERNDPETYVSGNNATGFRCVLGL
jgi:Sulfatase-modifying factor enzyme 1